MLHEYFTYVSRENERLANVKQKPITLDASELFFTVNKFVVDEEILSDDVAVSNFEEYVSHFKYTMCHVFLPSFFNENQSESHKTFTAPIESNQPSPKMIILDNDKIPTLYLAMYMGG